MSEHPPTGEAIVQIRSTSKTLRLSSDALAVEVFERAPMEGSSLLDALSGSLAVRLIGTDAACSVGLGVARRWSTDAGLPSEQFGLLYERALRELRQRGLAQEPVRLAAAVSFAPARADVASVWEDFARVELVLPQLRLDLRPTSTRVVICAPPADHVRLRRLVEDLCRMATQGPCETPWPKVRLRWRDDQYVSAVQGALDALCDEGLEKVVVSRQVDALADAPVAPQAVARSLGRDYPDCWQYLVAPRGLCGSTFVGATPERLVRVRGDSVQTAALAGTIGRGGTPERDAELGEALLEDAKNRREHAVVVDGIREALAGACDQVVVADRPTLRRLSNVQHLQTPIEARLSPGAGVAELVARLHPTPALGGQPRERALEIIGRIEGFDRGLYGGLVGWVSPTGDADLLVAIRSGLVCGTRAHIFAGAGIVPQSVPAAELEETRAKLASWTRLFGESGGPGGGS